MYDLYDSLFAGLNILEVTKATVWAVLLDCTVRPEDELVFGIDSADHYEALRAFLLGKDTFDPSIENNQRAFQKLRRRIRQLNAAAGRGKKIDGLLKRYTPTYAKLVQFASLDEYFARIKNTEVNR